MMEYVTCLKCHWVSFPVTKEYAKQESKKFLKVYASTKNAKEFWGERKTLKELVAQYTCLTCGGDSFRPSADAEVDKVYGCTISPVIYEETKK